MTEEALALEGIRQKLVGKRLTYREIYAIMDEIAHERFGPVLTTYFAASGYSKGFSNEEIYYLTKAMIETGQQLHFKGIVADKHSIGGVPGTRTTMIVAPIVASAGFTIPKSSSRAITTPGGTADDMEVVAKVTFTEEEIYKIVEKTGGCIVWGGSVNIAPADDILIKVEKPLMFESFDKILVSIMAKKVAFGSNHIVIDLPYGDGMKAARMEDAEIIKRKFEYLADRFNVKIKVIMHKMHEPGGRGVGPLLETREALRVLEQQEDRPRDLEREALNLAGPLLDLCLEDASSTLQEKIRHEFKDGHGWAAYLLKSKYAHAKMKEFIKAQQGDPDITSTHLKPGKHSYEVIAKGTGTVEKLHVKNASIIAKLLGAPVQKKSGIYFNKKIGDPIEKGEVLYTLYSESEYHLREAKESLLNFPLIYYS